MDVQSSSDRLSRTIVAAVVLGGICFGCMSISSRWLHVERNERRQLAHTERVPTGSVADDTVTQWFPDNHWVRQAKNGVRDGRQYLFWDEHEQTEILATGRSQIPGLTIDLKPIAMLWKDEDPGVEPIVVTADSAQVELSERFSAQKSTVGQIVSAWLTGNVVVDGPKGLHITGEEFNVDEKEMKLRSFKPVEFWWDGHSGSAEGGVEIALERDDSAGRGLTSVSDVERVTLHGPVVCDLNFDERRNQDATRLHIAAPTSFEFDLKTNVGIFHGRLGGNKYQDDDVLVTRTTDGEPDQMWSPHLMVEFYPEIEPETGQARSGRLRLGKVSAVGGADRPVRYWSKEHQVLAMMMQLDYLEGARQLDMFGALQDGRASASDNRKTVHIVQNGRELKVPHMRVLHGAGNGIERIECRGAGFIKQAVSAAEDQVETANTQQVAASIWWSRQLTVQREAHGKTHVVSVHGGARVSLPERQMKLAARKINMTLRTTNDAADAGQSNIPSDFSLDMAEAQPEKLIAEGDVIMRSPHVSGELQDQLTVFFHPREDSSNNRVSVISQTKELSSSDDRGHSEFFGHEMTAHVVLPKDSTAKQRWSSVFLKGDVTVEHQGVGPEEAYTAEGSTFKAENGLGDMADIQLFGSPAILKSPTGHVEAARIDLHQADGFAEINSSGRLLMIMDQALDGKQLPKPVPVEVRWTDRMELRGKEAHFIGGVRVDLNGVRYAVGDKQIHNTEIKTPELKVFFVEPINLTGAHNSGELAAAGDSSRSPDVERLQCVGETIIHQESFTAGVMDGLRDAEMVDLAIEPGTGDFSAMGFGWIESTTTNSSSGSASLRPVTQIRVRVNEPTAEIRESPFARIKVTFIGGMKGNLNDREVTLENSVKITFAPVQDLDEKIDLEFVPTEEMPEDSRILQAEEVHLAAIAGTDGDAFSMTALGNAQLISRDFFGDADRITYDHSKSQIILTGEQGRLVNGRHRLGGTDQLQVMKGPKFEYYLETQQLRSTNYLLDTTQ